MEKTVPKTPSNQKCQHLQRKTGLGWAGLGWAILGWAGFAGCAGVAGAGLVNRVKRSISTDLGALSCKYLPRIYPESSQRPHEIGLGLLGLLGCEWAVKQTDAMVF